MSEGTGEDLRIVIDAARVVAQASAAAELDGVVAAILDACARVTESDCASLYLRDDDSDFLVLVGNRPVDTVLSEAYRRLPLATRTGQHMFALEPAAYALKDLLPGAQASYDRGLRQVAMIPVHLQSKAKGVIHVARYEDRPYDARALRLADHVVELSSVYLENARLYTDAQRRLRETGLLLEIARVSASSPGVTESLEASLGILTEMLDASNAYVLLLDAAGTTLRGVATSRADFRTDMPHVCISMDEPSVAVRALKSKAAIGVTDARSATDIRRGEVDRLGQRGLVAIPLVVRDRAIGVIMLDDTRGPRRWSESELQRAELVTRQLAISVANAQLYDALRASYGELARTQEELVKRERLAAIGQLSATLAHEVRNPLGVIFNSLATFGKLIEPRGDAATLLAIMREEAGRLDHLVRELLEFARPRPPAFDSESLREVVEGAVSAARRELGEDHVSVDVQIAEDLPPVRIDASMMRRAVVNLVVNAVQASEGHVTPVVVRARAERRGDRRFARLDVVDRGDGIPPSIAERVAEPFFTTKATGTGLGLAVVKGIVESHHGRFELASHPGHGTCATVLVPLE